jgi:hypothetical protein
MSSANGANVCKKEIILRSPESIETERVKTETEKKKFFALHRAETLCAARRFWVTVRYRVDAEFNDTRSMASEFAFNLISHCGKQPQGEWN